MDARLSPLLTAALLILGALVLLPVLGVLVMAAWEGRMPFAAIDPVGELPVWLLVWGFLLAIFLALLLVWILQVFAAWFAARGSGAGRQSRVE